MMRMHITREPWPPAPRSLSTYKMMTSVGAATHAAILKVTSGTSAPTIPGRANAVVSGISAGRDSRGIRRLAVTIGLLAVMAASVVVAGSLYRARRPGQPTPEAVASEAEARATRTAQERLNAESSARRAAEQATSEAKEQLGRERMARETAERAAAQLDRERAAREVAEHVATEAREQLGRERSAKNIALKAAAQLRRQLIQVRAAKQQVGETYVDPESATAEAKSASAKPKQKQRESAVSGGIGSRCSGPFPRPRAELAWLEEDDVPREG